ncbi:monovalent cation/H+ antiporter subunit D [Thiomicrorhabdus arctica]|uniref:monovalent cation/H+ antiporter subunit D n=1 Tax=Thiomicrorhabdus arctica TaxID=131540 RepID=UPI000365E11B|nr:monovalent cation/H+ antiporter subunit D [Thiomicrorhabdus arctica]
MMSLTAVPLLIPLVMSFILLLARMQGIQLQRVLNLIVVTLLIIVSSVLVNNSLTGEYQIYLLGNWQAPFGIVLVLDQLSAMMLLITSILALGALWYAIKTKIDENGSHFHVLFQLQLFGLNGAFMTGDLFNLFVFFEVLLLASYGLILHGSGAQRTKASLHYVIINLIGSTLFLFAVGALYGILGTLNIADLANKIAILPVENQAVVAAAGLLLLVVFGIKAAMFPLYLWLPAAYANTSAPVAALFAIMTKVGIYSIIRVHGTLFNEDAGELAFYYLPWILALGLITLVLASLGVMAARGLREQVAYLVLASVATLLIGIGLNSPAALSATFYYLIHSTLIAGAMFLLADIIARGRGSLEDKFISAPSMPSAILVGSIFIFAAIAMTGMPPFSGFLGKLLILSAALDHAWFGVVFAVILISSLLLIIAMARSGSLLFYNTQTVTTETTQTGKPLNKSALMSVVGLLSAAVILVVFANPITDYTQQIAQQQFNSSNYIQAVLSATAITE